MLVNVVDVPPLCNFILPAIVRTGPLAIAISTAGASPALAKRIKRQIADEYGEPYARLAVLLNEARGWAKGTLPTYQDRKEFFEGIVNGDPDPVELLRAGDEAGVRELIAAAQRAHAPAAGLTRRLPCRASAPRSSPSRRPSRAARRRTCPGPKLAAAAEEAGCEVVAMEVVPDDFALIEDRLNHLIDAGCDLIFTTGGTGLTPNDITPEATRAVIDREAPGFAEAMRAEGVRHTPMGILSRGISGIAGPHADRQLPGLAEGGRGALRRARADARARGAHAARRLVAPCHRLSAGAARSSCADLGRAYGERVALARRDARRCRAGSTLAVFGANGAGKTTLLRILATLLRPHRGDGARARARAAAARAGRCAGGSGCSATSRCSTAT